MVFVLIKLWHTRCLPKCAHLLLLDEHVEASENNGTGKCKDVMLFLLHQPHCFYNQNSFYWSIPKTKIARQFLYSCWPWSAMFVNIFPFTCKISIGIFSSAMQISPCRSVELEACSIHGWGPFSCKMLLALMEKVSICSEHQWQMH